MRKTTTDLNKEINDIAQEILTQAALDANQVSYVDALKIAVQLQRNRILTTAFVIHDPVATPGALEMIAISLGAEPNIYARDMVEEF